MERKQKEYDYKLMMFKNNISTISSKEEEKANELNKKFVNSLLFRSQAEQG